MADSPEEMARHKRAYWAVFIALCVFTVVTVALAKFEIFDFGHPGISHRDIIVGLLVAAVKSTLVALIFMHLNHEKGLIYKFLVFTFCFAAGLMTLTLLAWWNPIEPVFEVDGAAQAKFVDEAYKASH
jgi:caa(3)-type oxidase subunit IV